MTIIKYILFTLTVSLIGCSSDNPQKNTDSPLIGKWKTQACQENIDNINNPPTIIFLNSTYDFLENGDIIFSPSTYIDSTCTVKAFNTLNPPNSAIATYLDQGETTLEEGLLGNRINIQIQTPDKTLSTNGFYTINNNILCFSLSYSFEPSSFGVSLTERDPIDFTNCLEPMP